MWGRFFIGIFGYTIAVMGLDRSIEITFSSDIKTFSGLLESYIAAFCTKSIPEILSLSDNDTDDFDFITFDTFSHLKETLDVRELKGYSNHVSFITDAFGESILLMCNRKNSGIRGFASKFELTVTPGIGRRIEGAERFTDYGFYLNILLPWLISNQCLVHEITCKDYEG